MKKKPKIQWVILHTMSNGKIYEGVKTDFSHLGVSCQQCAIDRKSAMCATARCRGGQSGCENMRGRHYKATGFKMPTKKKESK